MCYIYKGMPSVPDVSGFLHTYTHFVHTLECQMFQFLSFCVSMSIVTSLCVGVSYVTGICVKVYKQMCQLVEVYSLVCQI